MELGPGIFTHTRRPSRWYSSRAISRARPIADPSCKSRNNTIWQRHTCQLPAADCLSKIVTMPAPYSAAKTATARQTNATSSFVDEAQCAMPKTASYVSPRLQAMCGNHGERPASVTAGSRPTSSRFWVAHRIGVQSPIRRRFGHDVFRLKITHCFFRKAYRRSRSTHSPAGTVLTVPGLVTAPM